MRKKAVKRSWSKHNVPMEIWWEILVRLPVRSLVRFRCVSRSWKVLIDDPDFCREHLVLFKNNRDGAHLLMVQGRDQCFLRYSDTMKTSRRLGSLGSWDKKTSECKSTATPGFNDFWRILFSVDGLVLLKGVYFKPMKHENGSTPGVSVSKRFGNGNAPETPGKRPETPGNGQRDGQRNGNVWKQIGNVEETGRCVLAQKFRLFLSPKSLIPLYLRSAVLFPLSASFRSLVSGLAPPVLAPPGLAPPGNAPPGLASASSFSASLTRLAPSICSSPTPPRIDSLVDIFTTDSLR